ncbi:hypothetical protein O181_044685, partial [Austropuccinia psidii MF-1]|nr:hypothetical protein [Austropuccinia psidii MF-1]
MQIGLFREHHLMPCKHPTDNCPPIMPYLNVETPGIPPTTIYDTFSKYQQIGTVQTKPKTGRPTILKDCVGRQLSGIITRCRRLTVAQVTNLMTENVSTRTIQREIHKL